MGEAEEVGQEGEGEAEEVGQEGEREEGGLWDERELGGRGRLIFCNDGKYKRRQRKSVWGEGDLRTGEALITEGAIGTGQYTGSGGMYSGWGIILRRVRVGNRRGQESGGLEAESDERGRESGRREERWTSK